MNPSSDIRFWDDRYRTADYVFGTDPNKFLASQAHRLTAGMRVLALADGEGRNGVWLAERGLDVLAVDASSVALTKARTLAAERGVTLEAELADLTNWDFGEDRFDAVVAIFIQFADPVLRKRVFSNIRDCLKPGGLLILQGYRPEQLEHGTGGPRKVENLYTAALLREAFSDMELLHLQEHDEVLSEGCGHAGLSALIDLVARKPLISIPSE